jgi:hypothetical protein
LAAKPSEWRPAVSAKYNEVTVAFYTHSALGEQTIYRQTDTFEKGKYTFRTERESIAQGPGGYIH